MNFDCYMIAIQSQDSVCHPKAPLHLAPSESQYKAYDLQSPLTVRKFSNWYASCYRRGPF